MYFIFLHTDLREAATISLPRLGASLWLVITDSKLEFIVSVEDSWESGRPEDDMVSDSKARSG